MSETNIPNLPTSYADMPGVVMSSPPLEVYAKTNTMIRDAVKSLGEHERGAVAWIATTEGVNLAVVHKVNNHLEIAAYVGKNWGKPLAAGIAGRIHW